MECLIMSSNCCDIEWRYKNMKMTPPKRAERIIKRKRKNTPRIHRIPLMEPGERISSVVIPLVFAIYFCLFSLYQAVSFSLSFPRMTFPFLSQDVTGFPFPLPGCNWISLSLPGCDNFPFICPDESEFLFTLPWCNWICLFSPLRKLDLSIPFPNVRGSYRGIRKMRWGLWGRWHRGEVRQPQWTIEFW